MAQFLHHSDIALVQSVDQAADHLADDFELFEHERHERPSAFEQVSG